MDSTWSYPTATIKSYSYTYGKPISTNTLVSGHTTAIEVQPLRYRGYVYDFETGLYYLQSRYYDPVTCRFVNADTTDILTASLTAHTNKNLFAYCDNNPISREDDGGEFWNLVIGTAVGAVVGGVMAGISSYMETGSVDWGSVFINAGVGAVTGLVSATGLGAVAQMGICAATSGIGNLAEQCYTNKGFKNINIEEVALNTAMGAVTSLAGSAVGKIAGSSLSSTGNALLNTGKDKLLIGTVREMVGQSHSSLIRQGHKYVAQGLKLINTSRGLGSVIGTGISATASAYNMQYKKEMRFFL